MSIVFSNKNYSVTINENGLIEADYMSYTVYVQMKDKTAPLTQEVAYAWLEPVYC